MSRRDMGRGEDLWGVDLGCTVRQFVSEPHDDAAFRSLFAFTVREGCLDHGPAGAGSGLAGGGRRAANGERGAPGDYPEFRVWAGMMGGKEPNHAETQRASYS